MMQELALVVLSTTSLYQVQENAPVFALQVYTESIPTALNAPLVRIPMQEQLRALSALPTK